jgi:hypothetical protein
MKVPAVFVSPEAILYMADGIFGNIMIHIPEDLSVGKNRLITTSKECSFCASAREPNRLKKW